MNGPYSWEQCVGFLQWTYIDRLHLPSYHTFLHDIHLISPLHFLLSIYTIMSIFVGTKTGAFSSYPDARTRETEWYCSQSANFKDLPATSLQWQVSFDFLDEHGMREPLAAVGSFNTPGYAESLMPTSSLELCTPGVLSNYPTPQGSFRSSSGTLATSPSTHSGGEAPRFEVYTFILCYNAC